MTAHETINSFLQFGYVVFLSLVFWAAVLAIAFALWWASNKVAFLWFDLYGGAKEFRRYVRWLKTPAGKEWERDQ